MLEQTVLQDQPVRPDLEVHRVLLVQQAQQVLLGR
jgi:hypothetical protein